MILIVNGKLLTHLKHAEGMSLRYGVYVMVLLSLVDLLISCEWCTLLYNLKRSRFLLVGEPALWGMWVATPYLVACL